MSSESVSIVTVSTVESFVTVTSKVNVPPGSGSESGVASFVTVMPAEATSSARSRAAAPSDSWEALPAGTASTASWTVVKSPVPSLAVFSVLSSMVSIVLMVAPVLCSPA